MTPLPGTKLFEETKHKIMTKDYDLYDFKHTILPTITFSKQGVQRVAFTPAYINKLAQPEPLKSDDARFEELLKTLEWVSDYVPHKFEVQGDEVAVVT